MLVIGEQAPWQSQGSFSKVIRTLVVLFVLDLVAAVEFLPWKTL